MMPAIRNWLRIYGDPKFLGPFIPASWAPWLIRFGVYLQSLGRECYHQCNYEKQCTIHDKLEKVYAERN